MAGMAGMARVAWARGRRPYCRTDNWSALFFEKAPSTAPAPPVIAIPALLLRRTYLLAAGILPASAAPANAKLHALAGRAGICCALGSRHERQVHEATRGILAHHGGLQLRRVRSGEPDVNRPFGLLSLLQHPLPCEVPYCLLRSGLLGGSVRGASPALRQLRSQMTQHLVPVRCYWRRKDATFSCEDFDGRCVKCDRRLQLERWHGQVIVLCLRFEAPLGRKRNSVDIVRRDPDLRNRLGKLAAVQKWAVPSCLPRKFLNPSYL